MAKAYPKEFKLEIVNLAAQSGNSCAKIAREMGIPKSLIYKWRQDLNAQGSEAFRGRGCRTEQDAKMHRLLLENKQLRMERDILKKAAFFFAKENMPK